MAEHLVKTLCHIVFILKLYSKFLLGLFRCPAYLQLAPLPEEPCGSGNATDYQRLIGIMGLSPLRGTLRAAPGNPGTEVSLYPTSPSWRTAAPHGSLASLLIARSAREVVAAEDKSLREKRKDPQHWIFCFQGTVKPVLIDPFTLQRTFFERISGSLKKFF